MRALLRRPRHGLSALLLLAVPAWADDSLSTEFWPEINAYVGLDERSRLLFTAAATRAMEGQWTPGKAVHAGRAVHGELRLHAGADPAPRRARSRNGRRTACCGRAWASSTAPPAVGGADSFRSYTGILELNSRYPTPSTLWVTGRLRVDLRDVNGDASQRYRVRVGTEWDTVVLEHPVAPYSSLEFVYDTRYDKWSRITLKAGLETPIADDWRVEPYLALQFSKPGDDLKRVLGIGLTFKVYFD